MNKMRRSNGRLLAGPPVTSTEWQMFLPCLKLWVGVLLSRDVRTHTSAYSTRLSLTWLQYLSQIISNPTPIHPVAAILRHSGKFIQGRTFINILFSAGSRSVECPPRKPVLALIVKIRKSQDFLAPISGSPGDQIFVTHFQKFNLNILKVSFME